MRILDLTQTLTPEIPSFPGDPAPKLEPLATVPRDHYAATRLCLSSHSGTHMDAPAHIVDGAPTLDRLPVDTFVGSAAVVDCRDLLTRAITYDRLRPHEALYRSVDFLLFNTGWDRYWNDPRYLRDYPLIDDDVVAFIRNHTAKGIGFDTLSLDDPYETPIRRHRAVFHHRNLVILENLCHLDACPTGPFTLAALPLKYADADGAPIRAVALLPE